MAKEKKKKKKKEPQLGFFALYSACLLSIESASPEGNIGIGTAFHVGGGTLVTARHVVEGRRITAIRPEEGSATISLDSVEVIYPEDESIDLALLRTDFSLEYYMTRINYWGNPDLVKVDCIEIGGHMDDWINNSLVLMDVVVFGYPPVPTSEYAELVAVRGEINAIIKPYTGCPHPMFIVSPTPRGGFSGGPVLTKNGYLIGVMTSALVKDHASSETGFGAAITVEPLWELLEASDALVGTNAELWSQIVETWPQ